MSKSTKIISGFHSLYHISREDSNTSGLWVMVFALGLMLFPTRIYGQQQVQIIQADSIVGGQFMGDRVQKILGHVHLRSKKINMYADSAYKFNAEEKVQAYGNIEIDTKKETIWADTLIYYTDIDFSKLRGRVIFESDSTTLFGNAVDYRFTNKVAHFLDRIRLEDQQGVLTARSGFYFRAADSATFRGDVQLRDSTKYLEGDRLFSNRSKRYYELHGHVFANDPDNGSMLKGDYLESDSTGRRLVRGHAWLENYKEESSEADTTNDTLKILNTDSLATIPPPTTGSYPPQPDSLGSTSPDSSSQPDTTHIHAARILSIENRSATDTTTTVKAYENVRIWSTNFAALSDSANYQSKTQIFQLWVNAKAWHEQIQLSGPYIRVKLQNGNIKQLKSYPKPFTVQQDTLIDRLNQIKGDTLNATFQKGRLQLIRVFPNSHLLRFTQKNGKPDGSLELEAPVTNIYFKNGKLIRMKSLGDSHGNYLPESKKIADKKLEGFSWDPDLRPKQPSQKMKRRLPPIPANPPFELPRRYRTFKDKRKQSKK